MNVLDFSSSAQPHTLISSLGPYALLCKSSLNNLQNTQSVGQY